MIAQHFAKVIRPNVKELYGSSISHSLAAHQKAPLKHLNPIALSQAGDTSSAETLLQQSLALWKTQSSSEAHAVEATMWCLRTLVSLKLRLGKVAEASSFYTQLAALLSKSSEGGSSQSMETAALLAKLARALAAVDAGVSLGVDGRMSIV